jgi:hypothetical protein
VRFTFVSGDIGGARAQVPVIRKLASRGVLVDVVVDSAGMADCVFKEAGIGFVAADATTEPRSLLGASDLLFVSSCASATDTVITYAQYGFGRLPTVVGSDGLFNHGFRKWRDVPADLWFAITADHATAIRGLRPALSPERVRVVGQPAFDSLIDLVPRKDEVRREWRRKLQIADSTVVALWWSQGMAEVLEEDVSMVAATLRALRDYHSFFIPRIHPKVEKIREGYTKEIRQRLFDEAGGFVPFLQADSVSGEELNLAADMIFTVTCTEDIKNSILGGPPVIHFVGPQVKRWFEADLNLTPPYLPDIASGQSLAVYDPAELPNAMMRALNPWLNRERLRNWQPPTEPAVDQITRALLEIAR